MVPLFIEHQGILFSQSGRKTMGHMQGVLQIAGHGLGKGKQVVPDVFQFSLLRHQRLLKLGIGLFQGAVGQVAVANVGQAHQHRLVTVPLNLAPGELDQYHLAIHFFLFAQPHFGLSLLGRAQRPQQFGALFLRKESLHFQCHEFCTAKSVKPNGRLVCCEDLTRCAIKHPHCVWVGFKDQLVVTFTVFQQTLVFLRRTRLAQVDDITCSTGS